MFDLFYNEPIISDITFGDVVEMARTIQEVSISDWDTFDDIPRTDLPSRRLEYNRVQSMRTLRLDAACQCLSRYSTIESPPDRGQILVSLAIFRNIIGHTRRPDQVVDSLKHMLIRHNY